MSTTIINTVDAKEQFTDLVNRVAHDRERVVLTRRGKEVAVIISLDDFKLLQESQNKYDLREAIESLSEARAKGTLTLNELETSIGA